jgi:hypothetical protein
MLSYISEYIDISIIGGIIDKIVVILPKLVSNY